MKRVLLALLLAVALAGCAGDAPDPSSTTRPGDGSGEAPTASSATAPTDEACEHQEANDQAEPARDVTSFTWEGFHFEGWEAVVTPAGNLGLNVTVTNTGGERESEPFFSRARAIIGTDSYNAFTHGEYTASGDHVSGDAWASGETRVVRFEWWDLPSPSSAWTFALNDREVEV